MNKHIKRLSLLLAALMILGLLAACTPQTSAQPTPPPATPAPVEATPTPEAPKAEQRIICLAPSMVEVVYALGLGDSIVGWSQYTDYPPEVEDRPGWVPYATYEFKSIEDELVKDVAVVSSFSTYNLDLVKALEPTLILAESDMQQGMYDELKAQNFNVLFHSPKTLDDVFDMILNIGEAAGVKEKAQQLVDGYKAEVEEIRTVTSSLPKVKVYLEIAHRKEYDGVAYGPYATGSGSPFDQMVEIAGGENVFATLEGDYSQVDYPDIVAANPDVILSPMWPSALDYEITTIFEIVTREGFEEVSAVKSSRVYFYDSSLFKRFGPRTVTAIKKLAYLLHPYYFENPDNSVSPWELGKIDAFYPIPESLH